MSDDFGPVNLVGLPYLDRISREERLGEEPPQKYRNMKSGKTKKKPKNNRPDASQKDEISTTSHLIDLRI